MIINFPTKEERLILQLEKAGVTDITHAVLPYKNEESVAVHGRFNGMTISAIGDTLEIALESLFDSIDIVDSLLDAILNDYTD